MSSRSIALSVVGAILFLFYFFVYRGLNGTNGSSQDDIDRSKPYMTTTLKGGLFRMEVYEQDIVDVLHKIAEAAETPLKISPTISGKISFLLEEAPIEDALPSVANFLELSIEQSDDVIIIRKRSEADLFKSYQTQEKPESGSRRQRWRRKMEKQLAKTPSMTKPPELTGRRKRPKTKQKAEPQEPQEQPKKEAKKPPRKRRKKKQKIAKKSAPPKTLPRASAPDRLPLISTGEKVAVMPVINTKKTAEEIISSSTQNAPAPVSAPAQETFGLPKLQLYRSSNYLTVPWGAENNQIGEYRKEPYTPEHYDSDKYTMDQIMQKVANNEMRVVKGEHLPSSFAVGENSTLYLPDIYKQRLMVFNKQKKLVNTISTVQSQDDNMGRFIFDITLDDNGDIYFVDTYTQEKTAIRKLDTNGRRIFDAAVPNNLLESISILGETIYYGHYSKNSAIANKSGRNRYDISRTNNTFSTRHYLVDPQRGGIFTRNNREQIYSFVERGEPNAVLGEDDYGYLYLQYGGYDIAKKRFEVRKISNAGSHVAVIDMKRKLPPQIASNSMVNRTVNVIGNGKIYQLYASLEEGVTIIEYLPIN